MIWSLRVAIVVIVLAIVASASWRLFVGTDYVISSPSMCPRICVGALVLDEAPGSHFHVGEVISFVPPGLTHLYTHRIVDVYANGTLATKGDAANIVDPWRIAPSMVRGREVAAFPALGWLDLALPFLALALTVILVVRRTFATAHRREWDRLFVSLMVVVPIWLLKPLVRGLVIATTTLRPGVSQMVVVNTGLLSAQFRVPGGQVASFVAPGHRVTLSGTVHHAQPLGLIETASFHWWGWSLVYLFVLSPLIWYLVHLMRPSSRAARDLVLRGHRPAASDPPALSAARTDAVTATGADPRARDRSRPFVRAAHRSDSGSR